MASGPETALSNLVRLSMGALFGTRISVWKYHADEYAVVGFPDLFGHLSSFMFFFELKVLPGRPTNEQRTFLCHEGRKGVCSGLIIQEDRDTDKYYFVPWVAFQDKFSVKDRTMWMGLPVMSLSLSAGAKPEAVIDLRALEHLIVRK